MAGPDESDLRSQLTAEVDEAFNPRSSWSTHTQPISSLTSQSVEGDNEESETVASTFSFLPSQDEHQIISGVSQQREQQPLTHRHTWSEEDTTRARIFAAQEMSGDRGPSESESQLPLLDLHSVASKNAPSRAEESSQVTRLSSCTWLPLTLRWPFMTALFISALVLGIVAIVLSVYSVRNFGLCDYKESTGFFFAWRFLPTLIAVLYALAITVLINDVKRTEAFAKLSAPKGSSALTSLFISGGPWWEDPMNALSKKGNNGRRSWMLLWVSMVNIMALLLVSPLSSGLLYLDEVQIPQRTNFLRLEIPTQLTPRNTTTDETYIRTISGIVQNLTMSAWLSDSYAVLPFWPANFDTIPFGASLAGANQQWQGQTSVFKTDLQCTSMELTSKDYNPSDLNEYQSIGLASPDGCKLELNTTTLYYPSSGGCWSSVGTMNLPVPSGYQAPTINQSSTPECGDREIIFLVSPFHTNHTNGTIAQLCAPKYFVAYNVATTVRDTPTGSLVDIDEESFNRTKVDMDSSTIDLRSFQTQFLDPKWATFFRPPGDGDETGAEIRPSLGGPLTLLVATIVDPRSRLDPVFNAKGFLDQARRVKQRFFGEALQAVFVSVGKQNAHKFMTQVTATETRLLVGHWIGITLGGILLTSAVMVALAFYCSRLGRRALNLNRDPGSTAAVVSMLVQDAVICDYFRGFDRLPEDSMKTILGPTIFGMFDGQLVFRGDKTTQTVNRQAIDLEPRSRLRQSLRSVGLGDATRLDDDWRPVILRRWTGFILLAFLASIAAALIASLVVSRGPGLHQSAFVLQTTVTFDDKILVGLAPYSIIPTIFAVAVKLWWGALEENFKRLQPYVMMAKEPTKTSRGVALSYINSPQVFASGKALSKGHWLLALVCLGAFWTEVFTVSMSAIWQKKLEGSRRVQLLSTQLEPRDIPQVFLLPQPFRGPTSYHSQVLSQIFENPFTSWLYGAVTQIAYNGSQPAWSLNGWSFAQVNISSISATLKHPNKTMNASQKLGSLNVTDIGAVLGGNINVITQTPAVRGRIECSPYETLFNSSNWFQEWDLHNTSFWNVSANLEEPARGYELFSSISLSRGMSTTVFADSSRLTCCANGTKKEPGLGSVGYWSSNEETDGEDSNEPGGPDEFNFGVGTGNLTVKWIVGRPIARQFLDLQNTSHFIWQEPPLIAALNCQPIIETANASVTVDIFSGVVQNFSIVDGPSVVKSAWSDNYEPHNSTDPPSYEAGDGGQINVTVSYGTLFMDALYNAAHCASLATEEMDPSADEDLTDNTFNFRLPGLNLDYMSYAMFSVVQRNPQALLDHLTLQAAAKDVFSTFFQHYASTNVTLAEGGRVFQPIGATLPFGLPPIINETRQATSYQDTDVRTSTNRTVEAIVHIPVNELVMSPTAVFLYLAILVFLACIAVLVYFPYAAYFKGLPRDVDTLASVIAFVYDSPKLQEWVAANEHTLYPGESAARRWKTGNARRGNYSNLEADGGRAAGKGLDEVAVGLGFFRGKQGVARWGVELEPVVHADPKHPYTALTASETE